MNRLQILSFVGCVVVVLPVFLCGCNSEKDREAREDKGAMEARKAKEYREARPLFKQGFFLSLEGQYQDAIIAYKKAIAIKPDYAHVYFDMGLAYMKLKQNVLAVEAFKKYLNLEPTGEHADIAGDLIQIASEKPPDFPRPHKP